MLAKSRFYLAVLLCLIAPGVAPATEDAIATGKQKAAFDLKQFKHFIDHELSRPKPASSLAEMGIPGRRVEGQLIDQSGDPISGVAVAIVEPIGYSGHCYFDNFDTTDTLGRFVVDGSVGKTRLIFRQPTGQIWKLELKPNTNTIRVVWPKRAKVVLQLPATVCKPGQLVNIQTQNYWAGMAVMSHSAEVNDEGVAVFEDVIPSDYYATLSKSIEVAGKTKSRFIEIAKFTVAAGEELLVPCGEMGVTEVTGTYATKPDPIAGNLGIYVLIERVQQQYEHRPPPGDVLLLDREGSFRSRPLAPGNYLIKFMAKRLVRDRFGVAGDRAVRIYRVKLDGATDAIDVAALTEPSEAGKFVEDLLQQVVNAGPGAHGSAYAERLKKSELRGGAELMMLRILSDPEAPYTWRRVIPDILQGLTDSPRVITGLLETIQKPTSERELATVIRALQTATARVDEIVAVLEPLCENTNHITRSVTIRVLGELATQNPQQAPRIAKLLQRGLADPWEETRLTAADYLGRLQLAGALPALKQAREDESGAVAVQAAFSSWRISGDPNDFYPTIKAVLQRDGLGGKWRAAYFMGMVVEQHPLPDQIKPLLRQLATSAGKPPLRSSFQYEQSRAAKAAQRTLDKNASLSER